MVKKLQDNNSNKKYKKTQNCNNSLKCTINEVEQDTISSVKVQSSFTNSVIVTPFKEQTITPLYQTWLFANLFNVNPRIDKYIPVFINTSNNTATENLQPSFINTDNASFLDGTISFTMKLGYNFYDEDTFPSLSEGVKTSYASALQQEDVKEASLSFMSSFLSKDYISQMSAIDENTGEFSYNKNEEQKLQDTKGCCNGKKRRAKCNTEPSSKCIPDCKGSLFRYTESGCHVDTLEWIPLNKWLQDEHIDDHFRHHHKRDAYAYTISNASMVIGHDDCHNRTEVIILLEIRERKITFTQYFQQDDVLSGFQFKDSEEQENTIPQTTSGIRPYYNEPGMFLGGISDEHLRIPPVGEQGDVVGIVPLGIESEFFTNDGYFLRAAEKLRYNVLKSNSPLSSKSPLLQEYFLRSIGQAHLKLYKLTKENKYKDNNISKNDHYGNNINCTDNKNCLKGYNNKEYKETSRYVLTSVKATGIKCNNLYEVGIRCGSNIKIDKNHMISDGITTYVRLYNIETLDDQNFGAFQVTNINGGDLGNYYKQGTNDEKLYDFKKDNEKYYISLSTCGSTDYLTCVSCKNIKKVIKC